VSGQIAQSLQEVAPGMISAARPTIIAIAGRKGGSGKTTSSLNLAGALAERGRRVLLVDLDPQASLTRLLLGDEAEGLEGIGTWILAPQRRLDGLAQTVMMSIDLYPGDRAIETAAYTLIDNPTGPFRLRKLLQAVQGYDMILLDTPPTLGFAVNSALLAAHVAVVPTLLVQQDLDALADVLRLRDELRELGGVERLLIVPNSVRNDSADTTALAAISAAYGDMVTSSIPLSVAIKHALNNRRPVVSFEAKGTAAQAYRALAERLEQEIARGH